MKKAGQERPAFLLYHIFWRTLDWLFPPTCGGCEALGVRWCEACQQQIVRAAGEICLKCGEPNLSAWAGDDLCPKCRAHPPAYLALRSYGIFGGSLRVAMHRLKYQRDIGLGEALSKHLIELYNDVRWNVDIITPVPLSAQRMRDRGYNQSGLLGRPLAYAINKPYQPGVLLRIRETRTQVGLSAQERLQNVEGAFAARADQVKGKSILVIDDVTTTGSTINACAQALHKAGASAVFGLTLARAASASQADVDDQPKPSHQKRR